MSGWELIEMIDESMILVGFVVREVSPTEIHD